MALLLATATLLAGGPQLQDLIRADHSQTRTATSDVMAPPVPDERLLAELQASTTRQEEASTSVRPGAAPVDTSLPSAAPVPLAPTAEPSGTTANLPGEPSASPSPTSRTPGPSGADSTTAAAPNPPLLAAAVADAPGPAAPSGFVQRDGIRLTLDGQPYRFTGYDNVWMLGCGAEIGWTPDDAQRDAFFAGLRPHSVVRMWLFPGSDLAAFDRVLATARKYDQKIVATFADAANGCGDTTAKDDGWLGGGWRGGLQPWITTVVPRYANDPVIAMWELINEPDGSVGALRRFFDDAGGLIHFLDHHHLVSSGTQPPWAYGGQDGYRQISASNGIDVLSFHEYDQRPAASQHTDGALAVARALNKPLMLGEFGVTASPSGDAGRTTANGGKCETYDGRAAMVRAKLADYFSKPGLAGALYWSWAASPSECAYNISDGDPVMSVIHDVDVRPQL